MSGDITVDAKTRVGYVLGAPADLAAPTVAELNAGLLFHKTMTPDGLMGFEVDSASVDNSALDSEFDTTRPGRDSFSGTALQFKKQSGTDTSYNTLAKDTEGTLFIRRSVPAAQAWAAGDKIESFPITSGQRVRITPAKNEVEKWKSLVFISDDPVLDAVVAA